MVDLKFRFENLYIPHLIKVAKSGCQYSAKNLANMAAGYINAGHELPGPLRQYIVEALVEGGEGKSVDKALCLKRGRGQKETTYYIKAGFAHRAYQLLIDGEAKTVAKACEIASSKPLKMPEGGEVNLSPGQVYKYFYELNKHKLL